MGVKALAPTKAVWDFSFSNDAVVDPHKEPALKRTYSEEMSRLGYFLALGDNIDIRKKATKNQLRIPGTIHIGDDGTVIRFEPDEDSLYPHKADIVCFSVMES